MLTPDVIAASRGRRILVVGAGRSPEAIAALVDAGAEVHCVDDARVTVRFVGSSTVVALDDVDAVLAAAERVGAVVEALHLWVDLPGAVRAALLDATRARSGGSELHVVEWSPAGPDRPGTNEAG